MKSALPIPKAICMLGYSSFRTSVHNNGWRLVGVQAVFATRCGDKYSETWATILEYNKDKIGIHFDAEKVDSAS